MLGDSKSLSTNTWPAALTSLLYTVSGLHWTLANQAVGGETVAQAAAIIDAKLTAMNVTNANESDIRVLANWGANDVSTLPAEATWKANYATIIDAVVAKWPTAKVYLVKPWRRGEAADCNTLAGWIDDLVALYPGVAFVGHDERTWLEGGDDGATMTTDGVHYSTAGQAAAAAQWEAIIHP